MSTAATGITVTRTDSIADLAWSGTLDEGDSWVVRVGDPPTWYGSPPFVYFTTQNNAYQLSPSVWVSTTVAIYPDSDSSLAETLILPATLTASDLPAIPIIGYTSEVIGYQRHARIVFPAVSDIVATAPNLSYEFPWLEDGVTVGQKSIHLSDFSGNSTENPLTDLGNGLWAVDWDIFSPLRTVAFQAYLQTGIGDGPKNEVWREADQGVSNLAVSIDTSTHVIAVVWYYLNATPVPVRIEGRCDGSEWTLFDVIYSPTVNRLMLDDAYTDTLDRAFKFRFSDGQAHNLEVRIRPESGTDADWIYTPVSVVSFPSQYYPHIGWMIANNRPVITLNSPLFCVPNTNQTLYLSLLDTTLGELGPYQVWINPDFNVVVVYQLVSYWLHYVPDEVKGTDCIARLNIVNRDQSDNVVLDVSFDYALSIPTRNALMPAAPTSVIPSFKKVKDPFTNLQTGYEFSARLQYDSAMLKAAVSVDSSPFSDITWTPITSYPPSVKLNDVVVPRDGLTHIVIFRLWHRDAGTNEDSELVVTDGIAATFDLAPPALPTSVSATLVRDGMEGFPDQVLVAWDSPDPVDIYVVDPTAKKRKVYSADAQESSVVIENSRKYGTQDGQPHEYRFGLAAFNRSVSSSTVYAAPLTITSGEPAVAALTPDEVAGTAEKLSQAQLIAALDAELSADSAVIAQVITATVHKIKDVLAKGGSVTLDNIGQFAAEWSAEKTTFRNGSYVTVPAARSASFIQSPGLSKGVKAGLVLSDIEAASLA